VLHSGGLLLSRRCPAGRPPPKTLRPNTTTPAQCTTHHTQETPCSRNAQKQHADIVPVSGTAIAPSKHHQQPREPSAGWHHLALMAAQSIPQWVTPGKGTPSCLSASVLLTGEGADQHRQQASEIAPDKMRNNLRSVWSCHTHTQSEKCWPGARRCVQRCAPCLLRGLTFPAGRGHQTPPRLPGGLTGPPAAAAVVASV